MNGVLKRLLVWLLRPVIERVRAFMEDVAWDVVNSEENEIGITTIIKRETRS